MFVCNPFQIHIVSGYRKVRGKNEKKAACSAFCVSISRFPSLSEHSTRELCQEIRGSPLQLPVAKSIAAVGKYSKAADKQNALDSDYEMDLPMLD